MAITGENPDQLRSGPKKYLHAVARATSISVKTISLPLLFIINELKYEAKINELGQLRRQIINDCGQAPMP